MRYLTLLAGPVRRIVLLRCESIERHHSGADVKVAASGPARENLDMTVADEESTPFDAHIGLDLLASTLKFLKIVSSLPL